MSTPEDSVRERAQDTDGAQPSDPTTRAAEGPSLQSRQLLDVQDLRTGFRTPGGLVRAVDGVSLTLDRGHTLGIVGESGSGKTVLSRSIMGLLPRRNVVRDGKVLYEGRDLVSAPAKQVRDLWGAEMAMVFQDPMTSLNPVLRIGQQITEGMRYHLDMDRGSANATALRLLHDVGIPEPDRRMRQYPHELSGGMRQRVMIAVALACGPKLLFADEPTTALDVTVQAQILNLLQREQRERDMAMVLVTHDLGVVAGRADEIVVMYAGQVVERATTAQLFGNVRMPYTEALLRSIPSLEAPSHSRLQAIPGRPPSLVDPPVGCRFAPRCPYVQDRCLAEQPPLVEDEAGHLYRCWFPVGSGAPVTMPQRIGSASDVVLDVPDPTAPPAPPTPPPPDPDATGDDGATGTAAADSPGADDAPGDPTTETTEGGL
jgi:peptide/nickel transport system ATP-binding protein